MVPIREISIGAGVGDGCRITIGVGVGWAATICFSLAWPKEKKNWNAPPNTAKNMGRASRGIFILKSKVVVCFLRISFSQWSNFLNGFWICTLTSGSLKFSFGGLEIIFIGPEVSTVVLAVVMGSVSVPTNRPSASRGLVVSSAI